MVQIKRIGLALATLLLSSPAFAQSAQPGGIETAVLVLDASGSMAGKLEATTKMQVAQGAVAQLVDKWDKSVPLGLTVYGGASGTCSDIRSVIPVGPVDTASFMSAVNDLAPKGSTPLTDAVIAAAEQLDYENNQATVILVSDGLETCSADPCEMATALEQKGIDLTVHVVGFGVDPDEAATLSCIAQNTGGQYKSADDAASLSEALTGIVKEVEEDKKQWRHKCGNNWGKNGRWQQGRWNKGKGQHSHRGYWEQLRKKWKKNKSLKRDEKQYGKHKRFGGKKPPGPRKRPGHGKSHHGKKPPGKGHKAEQPRGKQPVGKKPVGKKPVSEAPDDQTPKGKQPIEEK